MLTVGIVGLPNAGKSTLFNALTRPAIKRRWPAYPFCTIEPNVGVIEVPDDRLDRLVPIFHCNKKIPAAIELFDIAGLVRGASKGEGLGNKFLGHIRGCRCDRSGRSLFRAPRRRARGRRSESAA